ncbi:MAG: ATP-dependent DNA helicase [Candidatus Bathyarchaeia archaeon]
MIRLSQRVEEFFPYAEVRPSQAKFIDTVFKAVDEGRSVLIEGSNGLGKTVAALSACLPTAIEREKTVLYVARTHRQHDRVIEELQAISKKQKVSGISIRSWHEMCLNKLISGHAVDARTAMELCDALKANHRCLYYQNIKEELEDLSEILEQVILQPCTASEIKRICQRRNLCPYELAKSSLSRMNVISLSYLYVFDPAIRNLFLKNLETPLSKIILVVDEAHNLPETAADIASSSLSLFIVRQAEVEAKKHDYREIASFAKTFKKGIEEKAKAATEEKLLPPDFLLEIVEKEVDARELQNYLEHLNSVGATIKRSMLLEGKYPRSYIYIMASFLLRWLETAEDESFIRTLTKYMSKRNEPTAKLEIVALDPSRITAPVFSQVYSSIVMSGTLQPLDAYARITGMPEDTIKEFVPSPFPKEHVLPLISCGVSTAMEKRGPEMYCKIIKRIKEVVQNTPANTGIFTASYEVLGKLLEGGLKSSLSKPLFCEYRSMSSRENEKMIAEFKAYSKRGGAVLLGVQGGRTSEGVDFPGDEMNSVAIVGLPYAEPTQRVKAQINYFERRFPGYGREYGYVLPAMKKASQSAGRPIRRLEDKGAIVFLDHRFASSYCRSFLPLWLRENLRVLPDVDGALGEELDRFFRKAC